MFSYLQEIQFSLSLITYHATKLDEFSCHFSLRVYTNLSRKFGFI